MSSLWQDWKTEASTDTSDPLSGRSVEFEKPFDAGNAYTPHAIKLNKEERLVNYSPLAKEFVRHFKEFDESYEHSALNPSTEHCLVAFGISGVGKTTSIARLSSSMSPDEFYKTIMDRSKHHKDFCTVDGKTIGHTAESTTVVPRAYLIGGKVICDMPGFAETNFQRKIIIDVLQKCFLTRVQTSTFLVVVDINAAMTEPKLNTLMQHYHTALANLLGDQYEPAIEHLYFVLTKNNKAQYSDSDFEAHMTKKVRQVLKHNAVGAKFLDRLIDHHIIVDLEVDDNHALLEKIDTMIDEDRQHKSSLSQVISWKIEKLEAGENTLNRLSLKNLFELLDEQAKLRKLLGRLKPEVSGLKEVHRAETEEMALKRDIADAEFLRLTKEHTQITKDLDLYEPTREQTLIAIKDTGDRLAYLKKQSDLFVENFVKMDLLNLRVDVSKHVPSSLGKKEGYKTSITADVASDGSNEWVLLVMEYEESDETLKNTIGRDGSLTPHSLEQIRNLKASSVLYNSYTLENRCGAELAIQTGRNGILSLSLTRDRPFKVFIYSSRPFQNDFFDEFKNKFDEDYVRDQQKLKKLHDELKRLDRKSREDTTAKRNLEEKLSEAKGQINACVEETKSKLRMHREASKKQVEKIQKFGSQVEMLFKDERLGHITTVERILRKNQIETALTDPLQKFKAGFTSLKTSASALVNAVERFEKEDDDDLTALLTRSVGV